ncbi:hypothetical protein GGTG_12465 [Gaeumannomyces tritici R3-111a-1]|uniref:Uncharacterized protein n=1 Tax=Gaeumannomyces tritici (strain R3-111a-1) TaxID=644352 RepID=J3PG38_GAET3|nr:hypothetical protein GGTG_12465 [Gaeumannomyces tritici R3-111a-1]EJT70292.1 hypothetical protein GGTG_12465 [Gaeumannomyces tritici R3-111a-1]
MPSNADEKPFLHYTDDEAQCGEPSTATPFEAAESKRRWRRAVRPVVSHSLVFVLTSLLWIFLVLPHSPRASCTKPSSSPPTPSGSKHSHAGAHAVDLAAPLPHGAAASSSPSSSPLHNATSGAAFVSCGASTAEAKASGCRYDMLLNHWVAPACTSREWEDEYADDGTWYGYRDEARAHRIEGGPAALGEMDHYYTSQRDHINHCVQMWRRQYVALFEGRNIDEITASWGHTEHCSQFLLDVTDRFKEYYEEPILVEVGWTGCWVKEKPKGL